MRIQYLNTDLDLIAPCDFAPLTEALAAHGVRPLYQPDQGADGQWYSKLEIDVDIDPEEPDVTIGVMLDAIEALLGQGATSRPSSNAPSSAATLWAQCTLREFNLGYDCGSEPWAFNQGLANDTLRRIAACGSTLRITLYPPTEE